MDEIMTREEIEKLAKRYAPSARQNSPLLEDKNCPMNCILSEGKVQKFNEWSREEIKAAFQEAHKNWDPSKTEHPNFGTCVVEENSLEFYDLWTQKELRLNIHQKRYPHNINLDFRGDFLTINNVSTNIATTYIRSTYIGLSGLLSRKRAVKIIAKILRRRLDSLFGKER